MKSRVIILLITAITLIPVIPGSPVKETNWALLSAVIVILAVMAFFSEYEKKDTDSREIPLIATMAAIAGVSRIPFAALVNFQPTTFIVMITGYVFGKEVGFVTGASAALISNFFLGHGPWTPWQMLCWGFCGLLAGLGAGLTRRYNMIIFAALCGICGYLYGWIMNIWHWLGFVYPLTIKTFIATYIASFPADTVHFAGNIIFSVVFGKSFYLILDRF